MKSIAETGKDGPLAYTAAAALVVGQCCVIVLQLLPVPASLWMRLWQRHTARRRAELRLGQQVVLCTTILQIQGVLQKFFSNNFSTITVDCHFLTEKYFLTMCSCVLPLVLTVYEEASTRNKEGTHHF